MQNYFEFGLEVQGEMSFRLFCLWRPFRLVERNHLGNFGAGPLNEICIKCFKFGPVI